MPAHREIHTPRRRISNDVRRHYAVVSTFPVSPGYLLCDPDITPCFLTFDINTCNIPVDL
jgi:hypothetical protein